MKKENSWLKIKDSWCRNGGFIMMAALSLFFVLSFSSPADAKNKKENAKLELPAAQAKTIKGTVVDEKGEAMIGVTILVKGTSHGVVTDLDGNFSVDAPQGSVLVVSYVGYKTQEITIAAQTQLDIKMVPDAESLDEVVVIGYGTTKKRDLTGSVASVKSTELVMTPVVNAMEALQGKVAGLDITRTSGASGEEPEILLRGNRSLSGENKPLFIVDGIISSYTSVNPNDIESIEVLKDASSTAIYGSAGANGVIIITTKKGQKGKVSVDFNAYCGINTSPSYPEPLTGQAWIDYKSEAYYAANGIRPAMTDLFDNTLLEAINNGQWVDWVDESLRTGVQQNYSLSIRGGGEKTQGYFSLNYSSEQGVFNKDQTDLYTMRAGVDMELKPWVKAGIMTNFSWRDRDSRDSRLAKVFSVIPVGVPYDENGNINTYPVPGNTTTISPILDVNDGVYAHNKKSLNVRINPYVEFYPLKGLTFRSVFNASFSSSRDGKFNSENSYDFVDKGYNYKEASYSTDLAYNYTWENILTYNFTLKEDHNFGITALTSYSYNQSEKSSMTGRGFDYDDYLWYNLGASTDKAYMSSGYTMKKIMSFAGRFNYSYKGRYLLTVSSRWDGASQLSKDNRWCAFPAGAVAWRISDESFMKSAENWLDNLKLRVSYGVTGNSNIDAYSSASSATAGSVLTLDGMTQVNTYIISKAMGNNKLTWEKSYTTDLGLDFSVFKGRIDLVLDWYDTQTDGVLYTRKMPSSLGGIGGKTPYEMTSNIAKTSNRGIEIALNTRNIDVNGFQWNSSITFAKNNEKIKSIDLGSGDSAADLISANLFIGEPVKTFYGYKKIGIWQKDEAEEAAKYGLTPGRIKVATVYDEENGGYEHAYTDKDKQIIGHETPDWTLGFQNNFYWKGFDLNVFFTARWGQTLNADVLGMYDYNGSNIPANYNYWTESNPTNDYPQPNANISKNDDKTFTSLNYVDGSYWKIKNITLGYSLPTRIISRAGLTKVRIYGTVNNPFIFTKNDLLKDCDPESKGANKFPLYKQVVFGINVSF